MARVSKSVQEVSKILKPDSLAAYVVNKYQTWRTNQSTWRTDMKELRNYIFQTDTTETSNAKLPWKNKTSIPKICQIRDNLHANYMAALFPHDNWFKWEAATQDGADRKTARIIEAYIKQKIRESGFKKVIESALYDYIDYGNAFGEVTYENQVHTNPDGSVVQVYSGPKAHRISPFDISFDLSASTFSDAGKITRSLVSFGSLVQASKEDPAYGWVESALGNRVATMQGLSSYGDSDLDKSEGFTVDGFGSLRDYYSSDMVELLEYEGDTYNPETGVISTGRRIIVMDRRVTVSDQPMDTWLGRTNKEHVGWRKRPDNLMAMGPLDNLVGMQYRLDHLENLKADVFDQIALPAVFERGHIEEYSWGPGTRIIGDENSDFRILSPDPTALNADFQMDRLMQMMEQLVGAPREAMGIRSPGEKTAFEVQALENAAGRIFQQRITNFEENFVEPLLNQMLESARRNLGAPEVVKVMDEDFGATEFLSISPKTLANRGKLYPIGARHFAKQAQIVQNLLGFVSSAAYADPAVQVHISGLKIAQLMEENLNLNPFELTQENIRIAEQQATQAIASQAQENVATEILDRPVDE